MLIITSSDNSIYLSLKTQIEFRGEKKRQSLTTNLLYSPEIRVDPELKCTRALIREHLG